jgi:hypothetical protein
MKTSEHARGRPKGSGIDDEDLLREIARLSLADPELRPTTAIKRLGHTNPSTIRRVRDKFRARGEQIMVSLKRQASELKAAEKAEVARVSRAKRGNAAQATNSVGSIAASEPPALSKRAGRAGIDGMESWIDCAGQCTAWMLGSQLALAKCAIEHPAVTYMLRQQTQAINAMVAFCVIPPSGIGRLREATG